MTASRSGSIAGADAPANINTSDLEKLRSLLLADDRVRSEVHIDALSRRLDAMVSKDAFTDMLAGTLVSALSKAERDDPKAVARALAPAVVKSIRREIVNSRDDMVEALYPITGRMVRASVRDAISGMVADINRRLDAATSPTVIKAHIKAFFTRKPASTYLIADVVNALVLKRAILIDRETGAVVHAWRREQPDDTRNIDDDDTALLSSMFAAISSFANQNLGKSGGELRTLDLNGTQVALRHGTKHMLVVEHTGQLTADASNHINAVFEDVLERHDTGRELGPVPVLDWQPTGQAARKKRNLAKPLVILLLAGALGLSGWTIVDRIWFGQQLALVEAKVATDAPRHMPAVIADRAGRTVTIAGLVPVGFDMAAVADTLATRGVNLVDRTQPVAGADDIAQLGEQLAALLAEQDSGARAMGADLAERIAAVSGRLETTIAATRADMAAQMTALETAISGQGAAFESTIENITARQESLSADIATRLNDLASVIDTQSVQSGQRLDALSRQTQGRQRQFADSLTALTSRLDTQSQRVEGLARDNEARLEALAATDRSLFERARQSVDSLAIRFDRGPEPADPQAATVALAELATLVKLFELDIAIMGFGDEVGDTAANERVSRERATWVFDALTRLGVAEERLRIDALGNVPDRDGRIARQVRTQVVDGR